MGHCVDACGASGSQLSRGAASGGEGFHVDVVVKEISRWFLLDLVVGGVLPRNVDHGARAGVKCL